VAVVLLPEVGGIVVDNGREGITSVHREVLPQRVIESKAEGKGVFVKGGGKPLTVIVVDIVGANGAVEAGIDPVGSGNAYAVSVVVSIGADVGILNPICE
jgi:hypothetical protein